MAAVMALWVKVILEGRAHMAADLVGRKDQQLFTQVAEVAELDQAVSLLPTVVQTATAASA
jgi:hypothetical protein